jgi:hypothetical protein
MHTVYVHIGLHKTGTTYVQNVLRANREHTRAQGVEFPGGPGEPLQTFAVSDFLGRRPRGTDDRRVEGQWDALLSRLSDTEHPVALLSDERLSICSVRQARRLVDELRPADVHVIVTARDLGRVAVSAWQEEIKNANTWSWPEFISAVRDPKRRNTNPARNFWLRQDLPMICTRWASIVGEERLHLVTVPPSGSSPELLLARFCSVIDLDPDRLVEQASWSNENVGSAATEVLRRVNDRLEGRLNQRQYDKVVKEALVSMLVRNGRPSRLTVPQSELGWLEDTAEETIAALKARRYDVAGDLDDLRPVVREDAKTPDEVTQAELLEVSLDALALLTERYATTWWQRKKPDVSAAGKENLRSRARGLVFRTQRSAAGLADHNKAAAKVLGVVLKARGRSVDKSGSPVGSSGTSSMSQDSE